MLVKQLAAKMSPEQRRDVSASPIWEHVANLSLPWEEAIVEGDAEAIPIAYDRLPKYAADVLRTLLLISGPAPIEEEKLIAVLRARTRLSGSECRIGLARLGEAGVAFAVRKAWGERLWVIPSDLYVMWMHHIYPCATHVEGLVLSQVVPLMNDDGQFEASPTPFDRSFLYGLSLIARSEAGLTSKGLLPKKTIERLASLFEGIEKPLDRFGLQWASSGHYPIGVAMFLEAAHVFGLLESRDNRLALRTPRLERWLEDPRRERELQDWLSSRLMEAAGSDSVAGAAILSLRRESSEGHWHSSAALSHAEKLRSSEGSAGMEAADWTMPSSWTAIWLDVYYAFGWLELGQSFENDEAGSRLFRWKNRPSDHRAELVIQPNGELIAGPGCGNACRWELELITERKADEELTLYAITPATIAAALELGRTKASITRFLRAASDAENLPPSVEAILEQWTSRACQYEFAQVTLLRCSSPDRADWLAEQPGAVTYLLQRIGPLDFLVSAEHVSPMRKLLQQEGFPPRKGIAVSLQAQENESFAYPSFVIAGLESEGRSSSSGAADGGLDGTEGQFVYDPFSLRHYALADAPASLRYPIADWEAVPQMWSRQLRNYHLSTRKELLQKAISLETSVRLRMKGELRTFIPERLDQRGNDWWVTGLWEDQDAGDRSRLTPDMWDEMGLALPDGLPT
ncbi:helicase-associated domain-containing protein [Paenibacillus sp. LHD-117]|uniref:helicase-associated domain-containing protein n=1 Tax=Paenibacillus sp. LHD-117 TaxID=3071412 RepID=UPI0027DF2E66|nr:helicase-associated domain-containing protein [Paenibacillus sp. LHD-117]MDQ6420848.1 helicase-associated domain-containing protein [Paenibacillus sp. LHD-117]